MRAVDVVQPDVMYLGGMSRTLQVARMAAAAGLPCTPHSANLSLVTMCTMHLLGAIPNAGKYLEFSIEGPDYYPWQDGLFLGDPYRVEDGHVTVPARRAGASRSIRRGSRTASTRRVRQRESRDHREPSTTRPPKRSVRRFRMALTHRPLSATL